MDDDNVDVDVLLGPILIGSMVAYLLIGGYMVQLYHYLTDDSPVAPRIGLHILVALVTVAETTNVVFMTQTSWRILVAGALNPEARVLLPVTSPGIYALNAVLPLMVQSFFAWQITRITRRKRYVWIRYSVPAAIIALALFQTASLLVVAAEFIEFHRRATFLGRIEIKLPATLYLSASLACDMLITGFMIFILLDFKAGTKLFTTKRLLNSLIFNAVENGGVTTVCAALNLGFYLARPRDYIHLCFQYTIGGLYANVLLASLNGRGRRAEAFRDGSAGSRGTGLQGEVAFRELGEESVSTAHSTLRSGLDSDVGVRAEDEKRGRGLRLVRERSPPIALFVSTVTEVHRDEDFNPRRRPMSGSSTGSASISEDSRG